MDESILRRKDLILAHNSRLHAILVRESQHLGLEAAVCSGHFPFYIKLTVPSQGLVLPSEGKYFQLKKPNQDNYSQACPKAHLPSDSRSHQHDSSN